jgi:hypothetical protein
VTSYFEWLAAGIYHVDNRSGAMHGQRFFVHELRYGSDGQSLYLRLDFVENSNLRDTELRINVQSVASPESNASRSLPLTGSADGVESIFDKICEVRFSLASAGISIGQDLRFQVSLWQGGLPMDALPPQGWIEFSTAEPMEWMI